MSVRNATTEEGHALGRELARLCDVAEPAARLKVPELLPRCYSCAFREGGHLANGSPATQMDALKCVVEHVPFYCHQHDRKDHLCSGWSMMVLAQADDAPRGAAPWPFCEGEDR